MRLDKVALLQRQQDLREGDIRVWVNAHIVRRPAANRFQPASIPGTLIPLQIPHLNIKPVARGKEPASYRELLGQTPLR